MSGYIAPGVQHLDGYHVLRYARSRQGSSNNERKARQRCVMTAMLQQLNAHTVLLKFQDLVGPGGSIVRTEIPQELLGMLVDLALKAKTQKVRSVNFLPALINPWSYDPAMVRSTAGRRISASMVESSIHTATSAGGGPSSGAARKYSSGAARNAGTPTAPPGAGTAESDLASVCSTA